MGCQTWRVTPARTKWATALSASVALHATAVAFAVHTFAAFVTKKTDDSTRDHWSGAALVDVGLDSSPGAGQPAKVEPTPPEARPKSEDAPTPSATVANPRARAPGMQQPGKMRPPRAVTEAPADALARKILDYVPPSSRSVEAASSSPARTELAPGGEDAPREGRSLARAFTRALPIANTGDPVWDRLPVGAAGSIVVVLSLDEAGKVVDFEERGPRRAPSHLVRSVERALLLLRGDHFGGDVAGLQRRAFRLDVTLSDRPASSGPLALGYETPRAGKSGRAYFQLPSGRFVDVAVSFAGT